MYSVLSIVNRSRGQYDNLSSVLRPDQIDPLHICLLHVCKVCVCVSDMHHLFLVICSRISLYEHKMQLIEKTRAVDFND